MASSASAVALAGDGAAGSSAVGSANQGNLLKGIENKTDSRNSKSITSWRLSITYWPYVLFSLRTVCEIFFNFPICALVLYRVFLRTTDTQRELFFKNQKLMGLGRQIGLKFYEAIGDISGQNINTILALWVSCPWGNVAGYSLVHKSSDSFFSKILEKPLGCPRMFKLVN